jgi:2-aminoadipate transaminase
MASALATYLPEILHTTPTGGFYLWLTLPAGLDSKEMLPRAITELVAYTPGTAFYANGQGRGNIRLAFCYPTPEFITEGVRRLSRVITEELELVETFGRPSADAPLSSRVDGPPPELS